MRCEMCIRDRWVYRAKQLWQRGENIYLAGLNEDGTHHQTKYLRRADYLPLGATWLAPSIVQQFMMETFQPPYRIRYNNLIQVRYSPFTSEWRIGNKSAAGMRCV